MTIFLLCRSRAVPLPQQIADALRHVGYDAIVENVQGSLKTSLALEVRYASGKLAIVVKFMHDMKEHPDEMDYEYRAWLEELIPDDEKRTGVRRFIFVEAMENADASAVQRLISFLRDETDAIVVQNERRP